MTDANQFISIMDENSVLGITKPPPDANDEAKVTLLEWIAYSRCESMSKHRDISKLIQGDVSKVIQEDISKGIRAMKLAIKLSDPPKKKAQLSRHLLELEFFDQAQLNN